jgi:hypothetical protein
MRRLITVIRGHRHLPACVKFSTSYFTKIVSLNSLPFQTHSQNCEKRVWASSCLSVRPHGTIRLQKKNLTEFYIWVFFEKTVQKIQVSLNSEKNSGYIRLKNVHDISLEHLRIRTFYTNVEVKIKKTCFMFNNLFIKKCAVYEITWKNMVQPDRPQIPI